MKFAKGIFTPKNPSKYIGDHAPIYRSSWELTMMRVADENPSVTQWASEPLKIPYFNPVTNKYTVYVPDFLFVYTDKSGKQHAELLEIKPKKQSLLSEAKKSKKNKIQFYINMAKWKAAQEYCATRGLKFRIITEEDMFGSTKKKKK